jgi:hypothetical protein
MVAVGSILAGSIETDNPGLVSMPVFAKGGNKFYFGPGKICSRIPTIRRADLSGYRSVNSRITHTVLPYRKQDYYLQTFI